jgi:hypothetical protein
MPLRLASLVAAALVGGAVGLTGCGGSHAAQIHSLVKTVTLPADTFHSASHHYSVHQVELAFDLRGLPLRNVSPKAYRGLVAVLDGRPTHSVYVYVSVGGCKCALEPAIRDATVTRHGNVDVLWHHGEKSAVRAALRELN